MKKSLLFLLLFGLLMSFQSQAQEETKKVVIVKKIKDENGNVTVEREEASGKDADALLKKMKEDGTLEGIDIEVEVEKVMKKGSSTAEDITVEKRIENGKEITAYKIVTEKDGQRQVMEWNGDGDMPDEIAKKLEKMDIKTMKSGDGKEMTIIMKSDESDHELHEKHEMHEKHEKHVKIRKSSPNKVTLGIMIDSDEEGVRVGDIVEGSAAEKCGLQKGDTILKVNDSYIFNTDVLLKALSKFDKGDSINVTYLREGKEKTTKAQF